MSEYSILAVLVKVPVGLERKATILEAVKMARHLKVPVAFEWPPLSAPYTVYPSDDTVSAESRLMNLLHDISV